jgi:ATP-dependent Lon protease
MFLPNMRTIGVFPLSIVLFPSSATRLHIFEERYKLLIAECMEQEQEFAVNLWSEGRLHQAGCLAKVEKVLRRYEDGRMDILVRGTERHMLRTLNRYSAPYYIGETELLEDKAEETDQKLILNCLELYNQLARAVPALSAKVYMAADILGTISKPSFLFAPKAGLNDRQKQELLEMRSENQRLEYLEERMQKILPGLQEKKQMMQLIVNDGYMPV